jgi:hypothetical protein
MLISLEFSGLGSDGVARTVRLNKAHKSASIIQVPSKVS